MSGRSGPLAAITFREQEGTYRGSVPLSELALLPNDPAETMSAVTAVYQIALSEIRQWQQETQAMRRSKTPLSARHAWELGDIVCRLETGLERHSCRLDSLYDHLAQHAGTTAWLGAYRTFRRYVDDPEAIPVPLKWDSIAKRAKAAGQSIAAGLPVEG